jgi:hypothetical protein
MRDTSRHIASRLPPATAGRTAPPLSAPPAAVPALPASSARVQALRNLVAAGQYHVSPKWLAIKICRAAGIPIVE